MVFAIPAFGVFPYPYRRLTIILKCLSCLSSFPGMVKHLVVADNRVLNAYRNAFDVSIVENCLNVLLPLLGRAASSHFGNHRQIIFPLLLVIQLGNFQSVVNNACLNICRTQTGYISLALAVVEREFIHPFMNFDVS